MQKSKIWIFLTVIAVILAIILGFNLFNQKTAYATTKENDYNMAFYQVTEYVQNVKTYLAKAMISKSAELSFADVALELAIIASKSIASNSSIEILRRMVLASSS